MRKRGREEEEGNSIATSAGVSEINLIDPEDLDNLLEQLQQEIEEGDVASENDLDLATRAVVVLESNDQTLIGDALTFENEEEDDSQSQPTEASSVSRASASSISTISSAPSDTKEGIRARLTALFSLNPARTPRLAALQKYTIMSFNEVGASIRRLLGSGASGSIRLLDASRTFVTGKYTTVFMPYLQEVTSDLMSLDPRKHYDRIYEISNDMRAGILAIRHSYTVFSLTAPLVSSFLSGLGSLIYTAGDAFIEWLQSQQPLWVKTFLELLYDAGRAILQVSMDSALGMGNSSEVVPVVVMIVTVLLVFDKIGPDTGLRERLMTLVRDAFNKLTILGEYIIKNMVRLGKQGLDLAIIFWNLTRPIREYYTRAVGILHTPFYAIATVTTVGARALYLAIANLYDLGQRTTAGLKDAGERQAVEDAAGILDRLQGDAKRLKGRQNEEARAECLRITSEAEEQVEALLAEAARLEEGAPQSKRRRGGARKSKSRRRRRGPTVNKKQKKSRRYKRSNNRGGSRKNKKATKKRRN
jgi:fumarate reductase subunit D